MSPLKDTDLFVVNRNGIDYKITAKELQDYICPPPPMPWEGYDGGVWHVILDPGITNFELGFGVFGDMAVAVWDMDGNLIAENTYQLGGLGHEEFVFVTSPNARGLFAACGSYVLGPKTDTSRVTSMEMMFTYGQPKPEMDYTLIDTSNVTTIEGMFSMAYSIQTFIAPDWDLRKCTNMRNIGLEGATTINVENWKLGTNVNCKEMFMSTVDQNFDLSKWDTSGVINMDYMFAWTDYQGDLSMWCVENLTTPDTFLDNWDPADPRMPKWGQPC